MAHYSAGRINALLLLVLPVCVAWLAAWGQKQDVDRGLPKAGPWCPDVGDGTYKNPILLADYSDPDVIRVGDDFYLTSSSFSCFPGLPILHSKDLVNWTIVSHAIDKYPVEGFSRPHHGGGVWAPAMRFHDGRFYIFFGDPDNGIFMARTKNPAGPWEPLVRVKPSKGWIDTCPFWDDDGQAYLVHALAGSRAGISNVLAINRMSADGTRLLDEGKPVISGAADGYTTVEGPKLYKRNGYYYIMAPGGGVGAGYQIVFRSRNIYGPYQSKVVLAQGKTAVNGPHQGAWVQTQRGQDWFVHFQELVPYGRMVHLEPMKWVDDWPVIGDAGQPVLRHQKPDVGRTWSIAIAVPQTSDDFDQPALGLQWQWWANYQDDWYSLTAHPGCLRLNAVGLDEPLMLYDRPNLLLQKFPAERFTVTAQLDLSHLAAGESAGLVVAGILMVALEVQRDGQGLRIVQTRSLHSRPGAKAQASIAAQIEEASATVKGQTVFLRLTVEPGGQCSLAYSADNREFTTLAAPFKAVNDLWIGAKVGLFCNAPTGGKSKGFVDVDWFRFSW